jgi:Tol biopolymer transport system component
MNKIIIRHVFIVSVLLFVLSCNQNKGLPDNLAYLGQEPPGVEPKVFAPGIVSTPEHFEFSNTFTPDGKEFYFSRRTGDGDYIMKVVCGDDGWTEPQVAEFFEKYSGFEPFVSHDGEKMFFTRFANPPGAGEPDASLSPRDMEARMVNIWAMEKTDSGWGEPQYCVNGMYVTTPKNGTIYTTDIREATQGVCRYKLVDGKYGERERLSGGVNSPKPGAHPCIAHDESYVVFDSERSEDPDDADLFVSFRLDDGVWSEAVSLGDKVNTPTSEIGAALSPDGKYLFYESKGDIYWVSTKYIAELKKMLDN